MLKHCNYALMMTNNLFNGANASHLPKQKLSIKPTKNVIKNPETAAYT